jgi:hypothetical protein
VAKQRRVVQHNLRVKRLKRAARQHHQRVDLGQRCVGLHIGTIERGGDLGELAGLLAVVQPNAEGQLARLVGLQSQRRVRGDLHDCFGLGLGDLLDLDAAFGGGHDHDPLRGAIHNNAEVNLALVADRLSHQHFLDRQAFDVHP